MDSTRLSCAFGIVLLLGILSSPAHSQEYSISDKDGLGRVFDGIGGLSAGASSKLLYAYREPQRSQLLDILFKPKFGASLQILKVEIGGDDQSTDGVESSHMHEEWDESYDRGYEWWLMLEAKKRNPSIKLFGLSWAFPGWLGPWDNPYVNMSKTAIYTAKWIRGAKAVYNLTIDYVGIWNEKWCNLDYVLTLRRILDDFDLREVKIVACDGKWDQLDTVLRNGSLRASIAAYGVHYPGTAAPDSAVASNLTLWSSEDYSTYADNVAAGCWARTLNQNYVDAYFTSTIAWSLIAAFYKGLVCEGDGLTVAEEPWSGFYEVKNPIWMSAHTTQFTEIGWRYSKHGSGVGRLIRGGSYVALTSADSSHLTVVIETMTYNHSKCVYTNPPPYTVQRQKAVFTLTGSFAKITKLHVWRTRLDFSGRGVDEAFKYKGAVEVSQGRIYLDLEPDTVFTLTTVSNGKKGSFGASPPSAPFPLPYEDDFQAYAINQEPTLLSPQTGVWEVRQDQNGSTNRFARQVITRQPVVWIALNQYPMAIIGEATWTDTALSARIRFPSINGTNRAFLGVRVRHPQCVTSQATGIFFWIEPGFRSYVVTTDIGALNLLDAGLLRIDKIHRDTWYDVSVSTQNSTFTAFLDNVIVTSFPLINGTSAAGFAALGTGGWGLADFDDLSIS